MSDDAASRSIDAASFNIYSVKLYIRYITSLSYILPASIVPKQDRSPGGSSIEKFGAQVTPVSQS